jgi:putative transposase
VIACNHLPVIDGKGAWRDNRMIERLWRSLKYECVYLNAFETGSEMRTGISEWLTYYNSERPHSTHGILTPYEAYANKNRTNEISSLNETLIHLNKAANGSKN